MTFEQPDAEALPDLPLVDKMAWHIQGWDAVTPAFRSQGDYLHLASVLLAMVQAADDERDRRLAAEE